MAAGDGTKFLRSGAALPQLLELRASQVVFGHKPRLGTLINTSYKCLYLNENEHLVRSKSNDVYFAPWLPVVPLHHLIAFV